MMNDKGKATDKIKANRRVLLGYGQVKIVQKCAHIKRGREEERKRGKEKNGH